MTEYGYNYNELREDVNRLIRAIIRQYDDEADRWIENNNYDEETKQAIQHCVKEIHKLSNELLTFLVEAYERGNR